jgi:putative hemolysin
MDLLVRLILILILILINAYFAGSEAALVAANELKVKSHAETNKKARLTLKYINNSTTFLSTIQVGITFIGFINGFLAAEAFTEPILKLLGPSFINSAIWAVVVKIVITLILTYLQVVFGELIPKKIAIQNPEKFIYRTIGSLNIINKALRPLVLLFTNSANGLSKLLGIKEKKEDLTEDEIRMIVTGSGGIKEDEKELFENILDFDDQDVRDVMTHRTEMIAFDINDTYQDLIKIIKSEQFSRIPVYENSIDNVLGILYTKDLITKSISKNNFEIKNIIRKAVYVPESMKTSALFKQMQKSKTHIAIVVDEYGGISGLVTMEDILEEIFGNIFDEYDDVVEEVVQIAENVYIIDGLASIDTVDDIINANLPVDDYDTLSGFILDQLGRLPEQNEVIKFTYNNFMYEVIKYDESIIETVRVTKLFDKEEELE